MKASFNSCNAQFARPGQARVLTTTRAAQAAASPSTLRAACYLPIRRASEAPIHSTFAVKALTAVPRIPAGCTAGMPSALPLTFNSSKPTSRRVATAAVPSTTIPATNGAGSRAHEAAAKPSTALIVGSGMGGLAAAAALSDHFDQVVLLEADQHAEAWSHSVLEANQATHGHTRPGVGQYNLLHVLLARGAQELDKLVPGFVDTLLERGAVQSDFLTQCKFVMPAGRFIPVPNSQQPLLMVQASRHLIEQTLRDLVTQNPKIKTTYGSHVTGLEFSDSSKPTDKHTTAAAAAEIKNQGRSGSSSSSGSSRRVVGVQLADERFVPADLVVVANGRRSDVAGWLRDEGWPDAPVSKTTANCRYVCWHTELDPAVEASLPHKGTYFQVQPPHHDVAAFVQRIEGGTWIASTANFDNQGPKPDVADILQYIKEVPYISETYDILKGSKPLSEVFSFGRLGNLWHHYEKVLPPEGLLIIGDAYCNFNPIYGQGMTVAAIEASILKSLLAQRQSKPTKPQSAAGGGSTDSHGIDTTDGSRLELSGLAAEFYPAATPVVAHAWLMAALRDLTYPFATSEDESVTWSQRLLMRYVDVICKLATFDTEASEMFCRGIHMLDSPSAVFRPSMVAKVLAHVVLGWPWGLSQQNNKVVTEVERDGTLIEQLAGRSQSTGQSQPQG